MIPLEHFICAFIHFSQTFLEAKFRGQYTSYLGGGVYIAELCWEILNQLVIPSIALTKPLEAN